jgi:hypothetical protein
MMGEDSVGRVDMAEVRVRIEVGSPHNAGLETITSVTQFEQTNMLTLKHFILKQQVLNLYRHAVRASNGASSFHKPQPSVLLTTTAADSHTGPRDKERDRSLDSQ